MCSSEFVQQSWITFLYGFNNSINNYQKLDRPLLSTHLQVLAWLCEEAKVSIDRWTFVLNNKVTINSALFTRSLFESFVNSTIHAIKTLAPSYFQILIPFLTEMLEGNLLPSAFNTDWIVEYGNESNGYLIRNIPRLYMNGTCNCVTSKLCQDYLRVGPPDLVLPGLVVGCMPIEGLTMSTLECFYSSDCISTITTHLEYYMQVDGSPPNNFIPPVIPPIVIPPLDNSTPSRFLPNSSIGSLINEIFVEDWVTTTSYENYFRACIPSLCQYRYTKRQNMIYIALSLLAVYGGLTVGWRFSVWNGLILYRWIKRWYVTRQTTVQPITIAK